MHCSRRQKVSIVNRIIIEEGPVRETLLPGFVFIDTLSALFRSGTNRDTGKNQDGAKNLKECNPFMSEKCKEQTDDRHKVEVNAGNSGIDLFQSIIP